MSAARALQLALMAATRQRDQAHKSLAQQQQAFVQEQARMAQLDDYAQELHQRWGAQPGRAMAGEVLHHHQHFMQRMQHARSVQEGVLHARQSQMHSARQTLGRSEQRLDGLQQLHLLAQRQRLLQQNRRAQRRMDELHAARTLTD